MLIRKINYVFMKHSRWLFGIFTAVIIVTFMGFLTPGSMGFGEVDPSKTHIGTIYGEEITYQDLQEQMTNQAVFSRVVYGFAMNNNSPQMAFQQLALVKAAQRRGIVVSDAEVAKQLKDLPIFSVKGKFDFAHYKKQMELLRTQGIDEDVLLTACRSMLYTQKLQEELMLSLVTTPNEVEAFYNYFNSNYDVKIAEFKSADYLKELKNDGTALKDYFENNRSNYKMPATIDAEVVVFEYTTPLALKYSENITDAEIKSYYDAHIVAFTKDGKVTPYKEAKATAKAQYGAELIRSGVTRDAQKFAIDAYSILSESDDKTAAFHKLVADRKLKTVKTGKFTLPATKAGAIDDAALIEQLNAVYAVPVTNAVPSKEAVYVGFVLNREDERNAEFNEVAAKITTDFKAYQAQELAIKAAEAEATKLAEQKVEERLSAKIWRRDLSFTLAQAPSSVDGNAIVGAAKDLGVGQLSKVTPTADGALLVIVAKRTPADKAKFESEKAMWENYWRQSKMQSIYTDFQNNLFAQCKWEVEGLD